MQKNRSFTSRIAGFSFRHKWYVLAAWLVVIVVSGAAVSGINSVLTSEQKDLSNSDSAQANRLIQNRFGERAPVELVVTRSQTDTVDSPAFQAQVTGLAGQLRSLPGVTGVSTYLDSNDAGAISSDRHAALTTIALTGSADQVDKQIGGIMAAVSNAPRPQGYALHIAGDASTNHELNQLQETDLQKAERAGLPIALGVMVLAFGSVIAAIVPMLLAFGAIVPATGMAAIIGHVFALNTLVSSIISMIGLAVGIDYSLFIIGRYREELQRGRSPYAAISIAADSSGRAVFFSGLTVLLALAGMLLNRTNVFVSLGIGAMVVVVYAVAGSLTLLPALLGILGRRVNWLSVPFLGRANVGHHLWGAVTHAVQRRPVVAVVATVALLLAAAIPLTQINLGSNGVEALPHDTQAYQASKALQQDFVAGRSDPFQVVIDGNVNGSAVKNAIGRLQSAVQGRSDLQWLGVTANPAGNTAIVEVAPAHADTSAATQDALTTLRSNLIPQAFGGSGASVHVGGALPAYFDVKASTDHTLPLVFAFVLGLSFLLLLVVFRSLVIPAKAILMNLLSVGAAYGLVVAVFQKGFLAKQLGFTTTPQIEFWLPLFLFCILFGLSMDYHVFLLSRIKEEYDHTGDNKQAVAHGVQGTAGMITSAAIIMVAVFTAFSRGRLVGLQQVGFGLAISVFLDATIIRSILVPASMQLLGKYNWWMPSFLNWLPRINVEGSAALAADEEVQLAAAD